jgi:predicted metalloprotease with PDZ domain
MKYVSFLIMVFFWAKIGFAQDTTKVEVELKLINKDRLTVKVYPPKNQQNTWVYVIPKIVPGTYMKINYYRFYKNIQAFSMDGTELKVKRNDNIFTINGKGKSLSHIEYEVEESNAKGPVWDQVIGCAGTIFTNSSFLLNFQLINGYFMGYENKPIRIEVKKDRDLYGAGSLKAGERGPKKDVFLTENYHSLVDQPILYAKADTASFTIGENRFNIAVHSEKDIVNAGLLKPAFQRIMNAIDTFSGFTSPEDYHFLLYYVDSERLKGLTSGFGIGSALEHNNSSVYYFGEYPIYDSLFKNLDWIVTHEYFHTITPLTLHSEKISEFNFEEPDMSRHLWLYEGGTDYLSALINAQSEALSFSFVSNLTYAVISSEKRRARSMTESSKRIIKKSTFDWLSKIMQIINSYEKGKLIAFGIDMELIERSNGEKRLLDVLLKMREDYANAPIDDATFLEVLTANTYPEMAEYYAKYISGKELVPFQKYFDKLGYTYKRKGDKVLSYGSKLAIYYNYDKEKYYVGKSGKNSIGLKKGDIIEHVNGVPATLENSRKERIFTTLYKPETIDSQVLVDVSRSGGTILLIAKPLGKQKLRYPRIDVAQTFTPRQVAFRKLYFNKY